MIIVALSLIGIFYGIWLWRDGSRLRSRLEVAERLMLDGTAEADAMEKSGCNWWDKPWHVRLINKPPSDVHNDEL